MVSLFRVESEAGQKPKTMLLPTELVWTESIWTGPGAWIFQNRNGIIRHWFEKSLWEIQNQISAFSCIRVLYHFAFGFYKHLTLFVVWFGYIWLVCIPEYHSERWIFKTFKYNLNPHIPFPFPNFISIWDSSLKLCANGEL